MERLSFLLAGVQKAGTSSLYRHLRDHPELGMAHPKETHFFDNESLNWDAPDYQELHRKLARNPNRRLLGEATPITLYWTPAHERIRRYNAGMKFILLFRDPVQRAFSHWAMQKTRGFEKLSFSDAIRDGRARVTRPTNPHGLSRGHSYVERGFYAQQLQQLMTVFPRDQMLWLTTDELGSDPGGLLAKISDFLGIEAFPPEPPEIRSRTLKKFAEKMSPEDAAYLRGVYAEDLQAFTALTGLGQTWM